MFQPIPDKFEKDAPTDPDAPVESPHEQYLKLLNVAELLELRDDIDNRLPAKDLSDLNLAQELVMQYQKVKELQSATLNNPREEASKQATVINACNSSLQQLVKLQAELHTAERFKRLEGMLIVAIRKLPLELAEAFLEEYESIGAEK